MNRIFVIRFVIRLVVEQLDSKNGPTLIESSMLGYVVASVSLDLSKPEDFEICMFLFSELLLFCQIILKL